MITTFFFKLFFPWNDFPDFFESEVDCPLLPLDSDNKMEGADERDRVIEIQRELERRGKVDIEVEVESDDKNNDNSNNNNNNDDNNNNNNNNNNDNNNNNKNICEDKNKEDNDDNSMISSNARTELLHMAFSTAQGIHDAVRTCPSTAYLSVLICKIQIK